MHFDPRKTLAFTTAAALLGLLVTPALGADAPAGLKTETAANAAAEHSLADQSAKKLIGQDVKNAAGDGLGQVKDLIIDARAGTIVYALVGSGGLLGVGEKIRAVPFAAFRETYRSDGDLVLAIDRAHWSNLPALRKSEVDTLLSEAQARGVFEQFGLEWQDESRRIRRELANAADNKGGPKLMRVSKLAGQDVMNAGQQVGTIEDVILNFETRRASVLLDPNDEYTGSNQRFLVDFNQLSQSLDDPERLTTVLTRAEFSRAVPAQEPWWTIAGGFPYVWTGAGAFASPAYSATFADGTAGRDPSDRRGPALGATSSRPSISVIRDAVERDQHVREAVRDLEIEERNGRLVVRGTTRSKDAKERLDDRLEDLAIGWDVDNQVKVQAAAE